MVTRKVQYRNNCPRLLKCNVNRCALYPNYSDFYTNLENDKQKSTFAKYISVKIIIVSFDSTIHSLLMKGIEAITDIKVILAVANFILLYFK